MPLYEYYCSCGCRFNDLQPPPGQPTMKCIRCGKKALKIISACAIRFKGSGFHSTDYDAYGPKGSK